MNSLAPPLLPFYLDPELNTLDFEPTFIMTLENKEVEVTPISNKSLEHPRKISYYFYRSVIEVTKIATAALYGAIHGITHAKDIICDIGAPAGAFSALTAIALRSGKEDAPLSNLYKKYLQIPTILYAEENFPNHTSLPKLTSALELTNSWFINATPQEFFFSGILNGSLLHEFFSTQPLAAKEGILASEHVEELAFQMGVTEQKEKYPTFYAETTARVSAWGSSLATVTLLSEILRYGFNEESYKNHTFSGHVSKNIITPIRDIYQLSRAYFS